MINCAQIFDLIALSEFWILFFLIYFSYVLIFFDHNTTMSSLFVKKYYLLKLLIGFVVLFLLSIFVYTTWSEKYIAPASIFVASVLTYVLNRNLSKLLFKSQRTKQLFDEYYAEDFIKHRNSLWKTREKVISGQVSMTYIVKGFIYPFEGSCYIGENHYGYSEHQHITLYLGFFHRLAYAYENDQIDISYLRSAFQHAFLWNYEFFVHFNLCAKELLKKKYPESEPNIKPYFLDTLETIEKFIEIDDSNIKKMIFRDKHYELKEWEYK